MRLRLIFFAVLSSVLSGILFWKNTRQYSDKPVWWRAVKSATELALIFVTAIRIPVVLVSWICLWLTKPIETTWIKATVGALAGITLGFLATYALEVLLIIGALSIDDITGSQEGFLYNLRKAKEQKATA